MSVPHKLLAVIAALILGAVGSQIVLGWVLGVKDAGLAVLAVAALFAVFVIADASLPQDDDEEAPSRYDPVACAMVAVAAVGAVACLYLPLPLPWGGLAAAGVIVALLVMLRAGMYGDG